MSKIMMVGVDGSEQGGRAASFAANVASAKGAKLLVVYVIEWSPYTFNTPEENEKRHQRREEEIATAKSTVTVPLIESLSEDGSCEVEGLVLHGHPARALNRVAQDRGASQIFIGRTGHSGMSKLLFGSIASNLVQTSQIPITVVP